jgi:ADP-heptose:LPS heptosyltransferase
MKKVEIKIGFTRDFITYQLGKCYIMPEDIESDLRSAYPNNFGMSYNVNKTYKGEDLTGKKLLCIRTGGIGDMLFLAPALQYLIKKYKCEIGVATKKPAPLLNIGLNLYTIPFCSDIIDDYDYFTHFQGILENAPEESKTVPAVDLFFKNLFVDPDMVQPHEKVAQINYTPEEIMWLNKTATKLGIDQSDYVIGVQMESSSSLRNYPNGALKRVIDTLAAEPGVKIVLVGSGPVHTTLSNFYKGSNNNVIPAITYSVRQSIILAKRYNLIVAPDSFLIQVGGCLNTPTIGLYNAIPSDLRMRYFTGAAGLDCVTPCSPCYQHQGASCIKGYPSPCWSVLQTDDILYWIDWMYNREVKDQHFGYIKELKLTERTTNVFYS